MADTCHPGFMTTRTLESRYGMCVDRPSVSALITLPSADRLLLMFLASSSCWPFTPVFPTFSLPAKSTRYLYTNDPRSQRCGAQHATCTALHTHSLPVFVD